jgi:protein SCO1/2
MLPGGFCGGSRARRALNHFFMMTVLPKRIEWAVWCGLALIIVAIGGAFAWSRIEETSLPLPAIGQISDFNLTNQDSAQVSLANLRGQVWVADILFSRCPGPCAAMTRRLAEIQSSVPASEPVRFVSFTSDPEYDTPAVLQRYGKRFNADASRWFFLTGEKAGIRRLAVDDFKFVVVEKKPEEREIPEDLFIHSTWFVLVDQKGQVRGWTDRQGQLHAYFDSSDDRDRSRLLSAINQLLHGGGT